MKIKTLYYFITLLFVSASFAQTKVYDCYPVNWWAGMKWNKVQVLIRSNDESFSKEKVTINYPGVSLVNVDKLDNNKYQALDVMIASSAKPGIVKIECTDANGKKHTIEWPILKRREGRGTHLHREFIPLI
jgi:hypothetical protein